MKTNSNTKSGVLQKEEVVIEPRKLQEEVHVDVDTMIDHMKKVTKKLSKKEVVVKETKEPKKTLKRTKYTRPYLKSLNKSSLFLICKEHNIKGMSNKNKPTMENVIWDHFHPSSLVKRSKGFNTEVKEVPNGRPRKWKTPEDMLKDWVEYTDYCDNFRETIETWNKKGNKYDTKTKSKPKVYTFLGFCVKSKITRAAFYKTYGIQEFVDIITHMKEQAEQSLTSSFIEGKSPSNLGPLFLSKFGYSTKSEVTQEVDLTASVGLNDEFDYDSMPTQFLRELKKFKKKKE